MTILVGCPVAHRGWIIRQWADAALAACANAGHDAQLILAAHPDDPTPGVLEEHLGYPVDVVPVDIPRPEDRRTWRLARFEEMAQIRTALLRRVREYAPPMFLSVDSDILLHPDSVTTMVRLLDDWDATGTACFLGKPPQCRPDGVMGRPSYLRPNYAMLDRSERILRVWQPGITRRADVLMAIKLMSPAAYAVDYRCHEQGEDIGWALACREARLRFGWTNTVISKHVMDSTCGRHDQHDPTCARCLEPLSRPDPRCGY